MKQEQKTCIYPDCSCPFDKPSPDSPCFRGLPLHKSKPKCNCDTKTILSGEGCSICNPEPYLEILTEQLNNLNEEKLTMSMFANKHDLLDTLILRSGEIITTQDAIIACQARILSRKQETKARDFKFKRGDFVKKRSGSEWQGYVVGEYKTNLTPEGYAVESDAHSGSVQIYPAAALELVKSSK